MRSLPEIKSVYFILFASFTMSIAQVSYNWPCAPFDQQHPINGTFCENRPNGSGSIKIDHFHDGVDIDLAQGNNVYSVIDGTVTGIGTADVYGINAYVRVGRYAYVHVNASPGIQVGSVVKAYDTVIGTTNSWNHIHFKDGNPGAEINPLRNDSGLNPLNDPYPPAIDAVNFYINGTTTPFAGSKVFGLVDIVAKARDKTDNWVLGDNNAVYSIGYQIFDSTGTVALASPVQNFTFYQIPPSDAYVTNVYFEGSDISNYYYTITNHITYDSYWDTREYVPGRYRIKVFTSDPYLNETEVWKDVEIVEQDVTPPDRPDLMTLLGDDLKRWELSWRPNDHDDLAGYKVFFSIRGDIWTLQPTLSDQISKNDTALIFENFNNQFTAYFRLQAYDDAALPNFSDSSDVYGIRLSETGPQVLIVSSFSRRDGYFKGISNPFVINYGQALSNLDISFNSCSGEALQQGRVDLEEYPTVIYFTGDDWGDHESLSIGEQEIIRSYLQSGGNLILFGSEIGKDLFIQGSAEDSTFYSDFLKSSCLSDFSESLMITGVEGTPLAGFNGQLNPDLRPDVLLPFGSDPLITYDDDRVAGIYHKGIFPGGTASGQLIYLAFPIDQLDRTEDQYRLIEDIMNLLGVVDDINQTGQSILLYQAELKPNYPNPFNPATTLEFVLNRSRDAQLTIYSIDGRLIRQIHSGVLAAGNHRFTWQGDDESGRHVSSGVYLYRLQTDNFSQTKKMILIR